MLYKVAYSPLLNFSNPNHMTSPEMQGADAGAPEGITAEQIKAHIHQLYRASGREAEEMQAAFLESFKNAPPKEQAGVIDLAKEVLDERKSRAAQGLGDKFGNSVETMTGLVQLLEDNKK